MIFRNLYSSLTYETIAEYEATMTGVGDSNAKTKRVDINSNWYKQYRFIGLALYLTLRTSPTHIVNLGNSILPTEYTSFAIGDAMTTAPQYEYIETSFGDKATMALMRKSYGFDIQLYLYLSDWVGWNLMGVVYGAK